MDLRGSLQLINPEPEGQRVYQQQTSNEDKGSMFVVYIVMAMVHMI